MMSCPVVCFINPNSTESMTSTCRDTLDRMGVMGETRFEFITNRGAPEAIQGAEDGELATEAMLSLVSQLPDTYAVFVVGCFDDTGVWDLIDQVGRPVIGIGQAAYHWASLRSQRFVVLTTLSVSVPVIRESIQRQGFESRCLDVVASGIPVLELERNPGESLRILNDRIRDIADKYGENVAVILGCAGMTDLYADLASQWESLTIIDPVAAGLRLSSVLCLG